jgi:hypothetical protein
MLTGVPACARRAARGMFRRDARAGRGVHEQVRAEGLAVRWVHRDDSQGTVRRDYT